MTAWALNFGNYTHTFTVALVSQDLAANTSIISRTYTIHRNTSASYGAWGTQTLTGAAGTAFSVPTTFDFRSTADLGINLGNVTIAHDSSGNASVACSATWPYHTSGMPGGTLGGTLVLPQIPRYSNDYYTGSAWDGDFLDVWDGSAWKQQIVEVWSGSAWVRQQ